MCHNNDMYAGCSMLCHPPPTLTSPLRLQSSLALAVSLNQEHLPDSARTPSPTHRRHVQHSSPEVEEKLTFSFKKKGNQALLPPPKLRSFPDAYFTCEHGHLSPLPSYHTERDSSGESAATVSAHSATSRTCWRKAVPSKHGGKDDNLISSLFFIKET